MMLAITCVNGKCHSHKLLFLGESKVSAYRILQLYSRFFFHAILNEQGVSLFLKSGFKICWILADTVYP